LAEATPNGVLKAEQFNTPDREYSLSVFCQPIGSAGYFRRCLRGMKGW